MQWVKPTGGVFPKCRAGLSHHLTINMFCYSRTGSNRKSQKTNLKKLQNESFKKIPSSTNHLHKHL
jgi:hypothetical protein